MIDFHIRFPEEDNHEHEMVEIEVFSIMDDDGTERFYKELGRISFEGNEYLLCNEVVLDEAMEKIVDEKDEVHVFRIVREGDEEFLEYVEDYEEAKRVFEIWQESAEE